MGKFLIFFYVLFPISIFAADSTDVVITCYDQDGIKKSATVNAVGIKDGQLSGVTIDKSNSKDEVFKDAFSAKMNGCYVEPKSKDSRNTKILVTCYDQNAIKKSEVVNAVGIKDDMLSGVVIEENKSKNKTTKEIFSAKANGCYVEATTKSTLISKDCSQAKNICEEVTDNYVICNGNRYDIAKDSNSDLNRTMKKINETMNSTSGQSKSNTIPK